MSQRIFEDESLIKKASYIKLLAMNLAEGMKSGIFSSKFKGQGIEFSGVRDYNLGDDIRYIDWNVTARMGKPYVKLFDEERELQLFIILDASSSMFIKSSKKTKYDVAKETSALLAVAGELNSCPTGAIIFDEEILFACKPVLTKAQTITLLKKFEEIKESETKKKGSAMQNALKAAQRFLNFRSLVFVISDFRTDGWQKQISSLAQNNDVIALRIQSKADDKLPSVGTVIFEDAESDLKLELPSASPSLQKEWNDYNKSQTALWQNYCTKHSVLPVILHTTDEPVEVLNSVFNPRKQ